MIFSPSVFVRLAACANNLQAIEALFLKLPVLFKPIGRFSQRLRVQAAAKRLSKLTDFRE
jgi:hypothetical protein